MCAATMSFSASNTKGSVWKEARREDLRVVDEDIERSTSNLSNLSFACCDAFRIGNFKLDRAHA